MSLTNVVASLGDLVSRPEGSWSLAEGALALARLERPGLDLRATLARLDALGARARELVPPHCHPRFVVTGLARVLFREEGFEVVEESDEELPAALMLDQVLERKRGSATMLAIVMAELARRCSRRLKPIALPGRVLLRLDHGGEVLVYDPADAGRALTSEDCDRLVAEATGGKQRFRDAWLRPLDATQVLARILSALKASYWRAAEHERALETVRLLLTLRPEDPREIRDRGRILYVLGRFREAIDAFESYLSLNPYGEDAEVVRLLLLEARAGLAQ